ncbi:MAG: lipoprotein releasing system transrane protein LolC [Pseudomonadota bacterium]|jgi:lipoprotein-releasing system permease protein
MTRSRTPAFFIGLRYILARKDNRFISFTSLISMAGLTLGVLALIIVLSIFNGLQGMQRDRTLITVPHGDINASPGFTDVDAAIQALSAMDSVVAVAPYTLTEAMLSQRGYHQVTQVRGIDPELEGQVSPLAANMLAGSLSDLVPGAQKVIIGRALAGNLRLDIGDSVNIIVPRSNAKGTDVDPVMHRFVVAGIFDVRFTIGSDLALVHIDDSLPLLGLADPGERLHLRLKFADIDLAGEEVAAGVDLLNAQVPGPEYHGEDWSISEAALFNALKLEKIMTWFMLMMIVAIGAFNIVSTLVMVVAEKQADIAILRTMGASQRTVMGIFLVQGSMVGVMGILLGAVTGILIALNFETISGSIEDLLSPQGVYMISSLPSQLEWRDVGITCGAALVISFLATLYPAWRASHIMPAQVLRYE